MTLTSYLKRYRLNHNLSQVSMAQKLGVCLTTYNFLELGKRQPSYNVIDKICKLTGLTPAQVRKMESNNEIN